MILERGGLSTLLPAAFCFCCYSEECAVQIPRYDWFLIVTLYSAVINLNLCLLQLAIEESKRACPVF